MLVLVIVLTPECYIIWSKIAAIFFCFTYIQPAPKLWWRSQASWQSVWARHAAYWRKYYRKEWTTAWPDLTMIPRATCLNHWLFWKLCCRSATTPSLLASILSIQPQLCSGPAYVICSIALIRFVSESHAVFDTSKNDWLIQVTVLWYLNCLF